MSENSARLNLDDFKRFKIDALKEYLRARGQKTSLNRDSLEALCYGCEILNIPIVPTSEEEKQQKAEQYRVLLKSPHGLITDPYELKTGWLREKNGMQYWPPTMELEIGSFLLSVYDEKFRDLGKRMLSDYKEGKGYSYVEKWLGEILYHPISVDSVYCFLRAESTPSMNISKPAHKIWVMVEKVSGTVQSAYCTCFAG